MKFAVLVFPGSNCDHDAYYVLNKIFNVKVDFIWHRNTSLKQYDVILIPGGFSYGDYLRTGAIARFSPIMNSVLEESQKGKIIIGICNGFQILIESGLLPGTLINNVNLKFISKQVTLISEKTDSVFTDNINPKQELKMPIAHKQGNYIADSDTIKKLQDENRIAFKYKTTNGNSNPNGSMLNIAGILNKQKNVLGMMPHPERACDDNLNNIDGKLILESAIDMFKNMGK